MNLVDSFSEFKAGKNIDRPTMVRVLEDVFRTLIRKKYGSDLLHLVRFHLHDPYIS